MSNTKTPSLQKNFVFNLLRNISMILFPMITFPYLSRILLPEGIGKINFANSVVQYFTIFAALGIPLYGTREVAKVRDNRAKLNELVNELFQINIITTIIAYFAFVILLVFSERLQSETKLFLVYSMNIMFTCFGLDWLFQGLEMYEYITKRVIIIRLISICLMFIFVKSSDDYIISAFITVLGLVGSNIFNLFYSRKHIKLKVFKKYRIKKHLKPISIIFGMGVATSIYVNLDSVMLGFIQGDISVGYYTAAIKLNKLVLTVITSLGVILLPRLSYYIENGLKDEFERVANKALDIILLLSIPAVVGIFILSEDLVIIFSGSEYLNAVTTMKLLSPIILIISVANFTGIQILYPLNKEKLVLVSVIIGAIVNISLNFYLIPKYAHMGAGVATLVAESSVLICQLVMCRSVIPIKYIKSNRVIYLMFSIIMGICVYYTNSLFSNLFISVGLSITMGIIVYGILLIMVKDHLVVDEINKVMTKIKRR